MRDDLKNAEDVKKLLKSEDLPENFCIIPFINIILGPGGDVSVCRQKGTKHVVGNLKDNSLKEIWNGEYLQKWRQEFLDGKPEICANEVRYVHCHLSPEHYWDFEEEKLESDRPYPFKKLTANFNGECNLKCIMCDVWKQENGFYDKDNFWDNAEAEIFPYIKEIEMLSGEPLIQSDTFKLIDTVSKINPKVTWSFTTNGVWDFDEKIKNALNKITIKRFIFSIDSLREDRYAKIRINGDLSIVLNNLKQVAKYGREATSPFVPSIHFLVMKNNVDELPEVIKFIKKEKIKLILDILEFPSNLSLFKLSEDERFELVEKFLSENSWESLTSMMGVLVRLISSLNTSKKKNLLFQLITKRENEFLES